MAIRAPDGANKRSKGEISCPGNKNRNDKHCAIFKLNFCLSNCNGMIRDFPSGLQDFISLSPGSVDAGNGDQIVFSPVRGYLA